MKRDEIFSNKVSNHSKNLEHWAGMMKYQHHKVLVVDDEEFCIAAMKGMLFKAGLNLEF